jgi:pimeloyl-ACP methyl ester carboxylesterase
MLWHGLARTGRDFDILARHLAQRFFVICPDTIGRGNSAWSKEPQRDYQLETYVEHAEAMLDGLGVENCAWLGTSMGGMVGMLAAAAPLADRITRLVLNDMAPELNPAAIARIKAYVTAPPAFATMAELGDFLRRIYQPYGWQGDEQWQPFIDSSARRMDDGRFTVHYDPKVMEVFAASIDGDTLWADYDRITCPVLLLRGEETDLVLAETAQAMTQRGPRARWIKVPGCGHAPALNTAQQIAWVDEFLG